MTYKINGVEFPLQPTTGKWVPRELVGVTGAGHPVYGGVRQFEITWNALSPSQHNQFQTWFNQISLTGTAVVDLPEYGAATYAFRSYSGCAVYEPSLSVYFSENILDVNMIIGSIRT